MTKEEIYQKHYEKSCSIRGFGSTQAIYDAMEEYAAQAIAEHEAKQWKKYPENKPNHLGKYIITTHRDYTEEDEWNGKIWAKRTMSVIAFREPPKPYQKGGEG